MPVSSQTNEKERIRHHIVNVIFIIYWLLIFEGALRKWLFPSLHKLIYFIRDPFVLYIYYLTIRYRMWPKWSPLFLFGAGIGLFFIVLAFAHIVAQGIHPVVCGLGWRNYFWYMPLVFIIGENMKSKDLKRLIRQTLMVSIPIAFLVFYQFRSSPGAWINQTMSGDSAMLVVKDVVRTSGTFTFSSCQVLFINSCIAMLLACWLLPGDQRPLRRNLLILTTLSTLVCLYVSGSRSAFANAAIALSTAILSGVIMTDRKQQIQAFFWPGIICITGAILYVTVFSAAYDAIAERFRTASAGGRETVVRRSANMITDIFAVIPQSPVLGEGLGIGSNAGAAFSAGRRTFLLAENELPRIVQETGISGLLYIAFRLWLLGFIAVNAVKATRRINNPFPLLLVAFEAPLLLVGQITLQGSINGYGWLFAGFCLAANNIGTDRRKAVSAGSGGARKITAT